MPSCADLVQLLQRPSTSPSEQREAVAALTALPMTPQVWNVAVGALPRLVELMQHPDSTEGTRDQAKRALHHVTDYAFQLPDDLVQAASAGDLSSLVRLLHGDVGFVQSAVMFTLGALALNAYNRGQIIEAGAIGRLTQLLKSSTQEVHLSAAKVLCNLSTEPNAQALFISAEGALAPFIRLLKSSSVKVQSAAVSALGNIATNAEGKAAVAAAGAIPLLVHLLNSKATTVQQEVARTLVNVGSEEANQASIVAAGAIAPLILLLRSHTEDVQRSAASALCNIASAPVVQARIVSAGAVAPLLHLIKSRSVAVRETALMVLNNLSLHHDNTAQILAAAGAIDSIVGFLKAGTSSTPIRDAALTILANLAMVVSSHAQLITAGVIPHMVRSLSSCSEKQQCRASAALGNLAQEDKSSGLGIVVAGAIKPLINLLTTSDSEKVQIAAVITLGNLMACNEVAVAAGIQDVIATSGAAVAPLVHLLLGCQLDADSPQSILKVLLALGARHARAIAAAGAIPPLVRVLHSCSAKMQLWAASLLHCIGAEGVPSDVIAMEAAGAVHILIKMQVSSEQGSDMRRITSDLLTLFTSAGSSRSNMSARSGSSNKGERSGGAPSPSIPHSAASSSNPSIPPAAVAAAESAVACPQPPATVGREKLCWACGVTGVPLKKCSVCTVATYCSGACQKADWKAHKGMCVGLKARPAP